MRVCPNCKAENIFSGAQFCRNCGAPLFDKESAEKTVPISNEQDDDLEFVVTETRGPSAPNFFGPSEQGSREDETQASDDRLEISETADLLSIEQDTEELADRNQDTEELIDRNVEESPPPPDPSDSVQTERIVTEKPKEKAEIPTPDWGSETSRESSESRDTSSSQASRKASAGNRRATSKEILAGNRDDTPADAVRPIADPAREAATTQRIQKARGLAYFRNNIIRIAGKPFLHDGDEVVINNKHYVMRPMKIGKKFKIGLFVTLLVIALLAIASQFIKPPLSGEGEIVGLILDKNGQPYLESARVDILPLNKSTTSNAQGFFRFQLIPPGTYELAFELGDKYVGQGHATVTAGQMTLLTFSGFESRTFAEKKKSKSPQITTEESKSAVTSQKNQNQSSSDRRTSPGYGRITLQANVENARFTLDNKILGAGNNTYTKIKAGQHTVKVDKPGYSEYTEIVRLKANQTLRIKAFLVRGGETASEKLTADDYLGLGRDAMAAGDIEEGIADFSEAIDLSPGISEAYLQRAEAYELAGETEKAVNDYIRAGEIYRINGDNSRAIEVFSSALKRSPENIIALVDRGGVLLDNGEYRGALTDYEAALKIDREFYPALYGAGVCYFKMGNYKKAEKQFKKARKQNDSDPYLYHYMLLTYLARDDIRNLRKTYAQFKAVADPTELAELKSSARFEPVIRLIKEEDR